MLVDWLIPLRPQQNDNVYKDDQLHIQINTDLPTEVLWYVRK